MHLQAVEPARITHGLTSLKLVTGDRNAALECEAQGHPPPRIQWLRDGLPLESASPSSSSADPERWTVHQRAGSPPGDCVMDGSRGVPCSVFVTSTLQFTGPVTWQDKGNYTCKATNSPLTPPSSASTPVTVTHDPVVLNQRFSSGPREGQGEGGGDVGLAAGDVGRTVYFIC